MEVSGERKGMTTSACLCIPSGVRKLMNNNSRLGSNETLSAAQAVQSVLYTLSHLVQCESEVESLSQSANSLGIVSALSRDEDLLIALVDYLVRFVFKLKNLKI
jgi:hypothetical protein